MTSNDISPKAQTVHAGSSTARATALGDWAITIVLLVVMVSAFIASWDWPRDAAFFPRLLSGAGAAMTLVHLGLLTWTALRGGRARKRILAASSSEENVSGSAVSDGERQIVIGGPDSDEEGDENELSGTFTTATIRQWGAILGWLALLFGGLYLIGFLPVLVIFTIAYLAVVQKAKWWHIALYVLGTAGTMYLLFVVFLHLPMPQGVLTAGLGV